MVGPNHLLVVRRDNLPPGGLLGVLSDNWASHPPCAESLLHSSGYTWLYRNSPGLPIVSPASFQAKAEDALWAEWSLLFTVSQVVF